MPTINEGIQGLIHLGKKGPAYKDIPEFKADIAKILSEYSLDEQKTLSKEMDALWKSYSYTEKQTIMSIPHEVYLQVQENINKAPENSNGNGAPVDTRETPTIPTPVDPEENPEDVYGNEDEPDFDDPELAGATQVRTRGQRIKSDSHDYGTKYPGNGQAPSLDQVANYVLYHGLTNQDKIKLSQLKNRQEQIHYLKDIIMGQREEVKMKEQEYAFNHIVDECYEVIPEYLEKKIGPEIAQKLSKLTDKKKVHLVGAYDFATVSGGLGESAAGIFRNRYGDIYVNLEYLKTKENEPSIGISKDNMYPHIHWEIKHILVHELLHSQSIINYRGDRANGRRIGLRHINYNKSYSRGRGINEATTEHLAQNIVKYWYTQREGLDESLYKAPWESYIAQQNIVYDVITQVNERDGVGKLNWKDFHKAMILRKYEKDNTSIQKPTPLVELMRKIDGGEHINDQKRPYFFHLIMDLCDLVLEKNISLVTVKRFIQEKDIAILQEYFGSSLSSAIKSDILLNKNKTNFNDIILEKYNPDKQNTSSNQKTILLDGSEYVDFEEVK